MNRLFGCRKGARASHFKICCTALVVMFLNLRFRVQVNSGLRVRPVSALCSHSCRVNRRFHNGILIDPFFKMEQLVKLTSEAASRSKANTSNVTQLVL